MAKSIPNFVPKPSQEEIAACARALYEQKGKAPGHDLENWLEALSQLLAVANSKKHQGMKIRAIAKLPERH